ncbi:hypothetical protein I6Y99_004554 [Vibrio parahaemolyticus]|uniref:hypothetical protein n=1 Tax=Vibrio parahaemolyticus TaxID=670 RepID=UPI001A26C3F8|nr:hypothetical protein [Vibrio parahaemolyticus]EGQ7795933.1 hypothetical protein [Vibrio parahaemolyticus]EGQ7810510.1 hypothetical protein [Vibrio parahaemolyticus]EGQ8533354.1 hypothetical protein [Vibrio parahaemolyticus]MCZ6298655.1 hypothetical protein [Vibrio parahaemolyticus]
MNRFAFIAVILSAISLSACQSTGEEYKASTYTATQLNSKQAAKTIEIIAVLPAKVEVDNTEAKQTATKAGSIIGLIAGAAIGSSQNTESGVLGGLGGGVVGGAAGSMVDDKVLVDGVTLTYSENNEIFTSTQVGTACEFKVGTALVVTTQANETRVQPNATCPTTEG